MKTITLRHRAPEGHQWAAVFAPDRGMNLLSYTFDDHEIIDQTTKQDFETTGAGHGAIIGPHFHERSRATIPQLSSMESFFQIPAMSKKGKTDFFSHGVGRYCSWNVEHTDYWIKGNISGIDRFGGTLLKEIEGFDFEMHFEAKMTAKGLEISLSAFSEENPVVVGLHTYYALVNGQGSITSQVEDIYNDMGDWKPLKEIWKRDNHEVVVNLDQSCDAGFRPIGTKEYSGRAILTTGDHQVQICYRSKGEEHAFQFWHPKGASFACVEPIGAKNPRKALSNESQIRVTILPTWLTTTQRRR